jgi:hypothetical protein
MSRRIRRAEEVESGSLSHLIDENGHAVIPEGLELIIN